MIGKSAKASLYTERQLFSVHSNSTVPTLVDLDVACQQILAGNLPNCGFVNIVSIYSRKIHPEKMKRAETVERNRWNRIEIPKEHEEYKKAFHEKV